MMMVIMRVVVIMEAEPTPPIRIPPPWIIIPPWVIIRIRIGVGGVIVFFPEVDLFARNKRIPISHLSKRFNHFPPRFHQPR